MKIYFLCRGAAYIHERDIFRKNILILSFMEIRRARRDELPRLMEIYDAARRFMRSRGNNVQWVGGYPSVELVGAGIDAGEQWVTVQDGTVVATFWFAVAPEPTYVKIYDGRRVARLRTLWSGAQAGLGRKRERGRGRVSEVESGAMRQPESGYTQ